MGFPSKHSSSSSVLVDLQYIKTTLDQHLGSQKLVFQSNSMQAQGVKPILIRCWVSIVGSGGPTKFICLHRV